MRLLRAVWMLCMVTGAQASVGSADWAFEGHCTGAFSQRWGDAMVMDCAGEVVLANVSGVSFGAGAVLTVGGTNAAPPHPVRAAGGVVAWRPGSLTLTAEPPEGFLSLSPSLSPVPEPGIWALALGGLLAVGLCGVPPRPRGDGMRRMAL